MNFSLCLVLSVEENKVCDSLIENLQRLSTELSWDVWTVFRVGKLKLPVFYCNFIHLPLSSFEFFHLICFRQNLIYKRKVEGHHTAPSHPSFPRQISNIKENLCQLNNITTNSPFLLNKILSWFYHSPVKGKSLVFPNNARAFVLSLYFFLCADKPCKVINQLIHPTRKNSCRAAFSNFSKGQSRLME